MSSAAAVRGGSAVKRVCTEAHHSMLLKPFQTFGWQPDESLSEDDNFMDLTLIVTRSARLKQGSMACILVQRKASDDDTTTTNDLSTMLDRIVSVSTNQALYQEGASDVHAEIAALGHAAKTGRVTNECSAYITMPPCKVCFGALLSAGVKRIITSYAPNLAKRSDLMHAAAKHNIEMIGVDDLKKQRARVEEIVRKYKEANDVADAEPEESKESGAEISS